LKHVYITGICQIIEGRTVKFNKKKEIGVKEVVLGDKLLIEAVV